MNSEVYSKVDRVCEVCASELEEYKVLTYMLFITKMLDSDNEVKIKLLKGRMQIMESDAIDKIKDNFIKRNHDRYKCAVLTLVKELEKNYNESLNKVKSELDLPVNYDEKYIDLEEFKWLDEVCNPVYREYLIESVTSKHLTTFQKYVEEFGTIKLSIYYEESILEEYERLSYLYLKAMVLEENNIEKINRFKNRLQSIKVMSQNEEVSSAFDKSRTLAYTRALLSMVNSNDGKCRVLKKE